LFPAAAYACSVCGCGDPLIVVSESAGVQASESARVEVNESAARAGAVRVSLEAEYLSASAASDDNPLATETVVQTTLKPVVVWSPTKSLNLALQVPLTNKAWTMSGDGAPMATNNSGLGDVDLGGRWFLWEKASLSSRNRQEVALSAGSSLPTGADNALVNGVRLDDHAQLGTGSWGPYLGGLYALHRDPWALTLSLTGKTHTTNAYGYHYGSALMWSARTTYLVKDWLGFVVGVDGRYATRDTADGDPQLNTGGTLLAAVPGVSVRLWEGTWLLARAQLPFYAKLYGTQTVGPVVSASVQYAFQ
jgi:hypothetical protein